MNKNLLKLYHNNLSLLIKRIQHFEIPIETEKLSFLQNVIHSKMFSSNNEFDIELADLVININHSVAGTTPSKIKAFEIYFSHKLAVDTTIDYERFDLIKKESYSFNIEINGLDNDANVYKFAWHLDQNIPSPTPKYTHPYYHFQGGGQRLEGMDSGDILLVDFPRIPHPPMDLFLGIHFILNNFLSSKNCPSKDKLMDDYEYQQVIKESQELYWKYYFNSFSNNCTHDDFNFTNVFPLYIHT